MSHAKTSHSDLGILVEGLVAFLRNRHKEKTPSAPHPVPDQLARVFATFADHLVALILVARSDDKVVDEEREVILRYCVEHARKRGFELTLEEKAALDHYLRRFKPSMPQMIAAMEAVERLKHGTKDEVAELIGGARAVIEADGVVRLQEALYLDELQHNLHSL